MAECDQGLLTIIRPHLYVKFLFTSPKTGCCIQVIWGGNKDQRIRLARLRIGILWHAENDRTWATGPHTIWIAPRPKIPSSCAWSKIHSDILWKSNDSAHAPGAVIFLPGTLINDLHIPATHLQLSRPLILLQFIVPPLHPNLTEIRRFILDKQLMNSVYMTRTVIVGARSTEPGYWNFTLLFVKWLLPCALQLPRSYHGWSGRFKACQRIKIQSIILFRCWVNTRAWTTTTPRGVSNTVCWVAHCTLLNRSNEFM